MHSAIITAYCVCSLCCGRAGGLTASGEIPQVGVTIAAPTWVKFGTWVRVTIPGRRPFVRRVDDRTARRFNGRWDVLLTDHRTAQQFGKQTGKVEIIK